jgi:hypothetical protein
VYFVLVGRLLDRLGQKSCLHLHDVYPYLYIKLRRSIAESADLEKYLLDFSNQIDKTLNVSLLVKDATSVQHVYKIEPVLTK